jgi:hypothetical protein
MLDKAAGKDNGKSAQEILSGQRLNEKPFRAIAGGAFSSGGKGEKFFADQPVF